MKDIRKPEFMCAAIQTRSHNAVLELLIAMVVFFLGDIILSLFQMPAMLLYLMGNKEYMSMVLSNSVDFERIMTTTTNIMQNMPDWLTVISLLSEIGLVAIFILYCRLFEKRRARTMGFCKKGLVMQYVKGIGIGAAAFLLSYLLCSVSGSVKLSGNAMTGKTAVYLVAFLFGYMIQGMAEEVLCRGYLMVSLTRRYSVTTALILSSAFFAMLHGLNTGVSALAYVNLFLFAAFMGLLFIRFENIWIAGAVHSVWNFLEGNVFGVQVSGLKLQPSILQTTVVEGREWMNGGNFGLEGGLAVTVVLLAFNAVLLWNMSKNGYMVKAEPVKNPYDEEARRRMYAQMEAYQNRQNPNQPQGGSSAQNTEQQGGWQDAYQQNDKYPAESRQDMQNSRMPQEKSYENMGLNPQETPWHPQNEAEQNNRMTGFDQSYFKD